MRITVSVIAAFHGYCNRETSFFVNRLAARVLFTYPSVCLPAATRSRLQRHSACHAYHCALLHGCGSRGSEHPAPQMHAPQRVHAIDAALLKSFSFVLFDCRLFIAVRGADATPAQSEKASSRVIIYIIPPEDFYPQNGYLACK